MAYSVILSLVAVETLHNTIEDVWYLAILCVTDLTSILFDRIDDSRRGGGYEIFGR